MSWETLYWISQLLLVVFAGVALVSGAVVNKRQSKQLLTLERTLEEQREKTAKSEIRLEELRKRQERRIADWSRFEEALKGKPKSEVEVLCQPNDDEAYQFADILCVSLLSSGWKSMVSPAPIPDDMTQPLPQWGDGKEEMPPIVRQVMVNERQSWPAVRRAGALPLGIASPKSGIFIGSNKDSPDGDMPPLAALVNALAEAGMVPDKAVCGDLPDGRIRIIVGPKP
jgi:hypothetical protein